VIPGLPDRCRSVSWFPLSETNRALCQSRIDGCRVVSLPKGKHTRDAEGHHQFFPRRAGQYFTADDGRRGRRQRMGERSTAVSKPSSLWQLQVSSFGKPRHRPMSRNPAKSAVPAPHRPTAMKPAKMAVPAVVLFCTLHSAFSWSRTMGVTRFFGGPFWGPTTRGFPAHVPKVYNRGWSKPLICLLVGIKNRSKPIEKCQKSVNFALPILPLFQKTALAIAPRGFLASEWRTNALFCRFVDTIVHINFSLLK
jgi:hypothetical protein